MTAPEKQTEPWPCSYCGTDLRTASDTLRHINGLCQEMISAPTKHGTTKKSSQFYDDMASIQTWVDKYYRDLMLAAMLVELILLTYIALK